MGFLEWLVEPFIGLLKPTEKEEQIREDVKEEKTEEQKEEERIKEIDSILSSGISEEDKKYYERLKTLNLKDFNKLYDETGQVDWRFFHPNDIPNESIEEANIWLAKFGIAPIICKTRQASNKSSVFRPKDFTEYIGQEKAKDILGDYIGGIKTRGLVFPHTLIHGSAGMGKTTLAYIIAYQLGVNLVETITSDIIDFEELKEYIKSCEGGILFLDEIHSITRETAEKMYTIMEDFKYKGEEIEKFTLIGATTELGEIIKTRKPFYDRFKIIIELEEYNIKELVKIFRQYKDNMFVSDKIHGRIFRTVALNCRSTPRTGIRLLEATIYANSDVKKVLRNFSIIKYGYTDKDLKLLEYMRKNNHPIGLQSIASYLGTSQYNYLYEMEPYLLSNGVIVRTSRGRKITDDGIELIKCLRRK